jgi:ABC-type Na+ efflux pump permease subunit
VVFGKILAAVVLVPLQAGTWILLLSLNGVRISGPLEILLLVSVSALCLILLSSLIALHYGERTNAQTIFSLVFVIVIMAVLTVPYNPLNMVVRIATATAGVEMWPLLGFLVLVALTIGGIVFQYAQKLERGAPYLEG